LGDVSVFAVRVVASERTAKYNAETRRCRSDAEKSEEKTRREKNRKEEPAALEKLGA